MPRGESNLTGAAAPRGSACGAPRYDAAMIAFPFASLVRRHAIACFAALAAASLTAQAATPPAADPALPDHLKELKAFVAEPKMAGDAQAIGLMQKLARGFAALNAKDKERMAKGFGEVFRTGKLRTADREILYREASDGLAKMGADGAKELAKALAEPRFKDSIPLQAHMVVALGQTQDEKQVDLLLDTATRSVHDELKGAGGEALGHYENLDVKLRREVVKGLIRDWGSLHSRATRTESNDPNAPVDLEPQNARKTLRLIEGKWAATLAKLTGTSATGFEEWQRWLNKNPNWTPPSAKKP
jgi:hypothetical protein